MNTANSDEAFLLAKSGGEIVQYLPLLLGCFLGVMCGVSALYYYTQGVFIKPLAAEFGWSRTVLSTGALITVGATAALAPLCGALIDRFGVRNYASLSMLGFAFSLWLLTQLNGAVWQYFVLMIVLAACASGTTPLSFSRTANEWFSTSRGLALGIVGAGGGVTAAIAPRVFAGIVDTQGWRQGYLVMALFIVAMTPLIWWLLRAPMGHAERSGERLNTAQTGVAAATALRTPRFWILAVMLMLASLGASGVIVHFVPMLTDAGMTPQRAAAYAGVIGMSVVASRVIAGALMDWMFAPRVALIVFASASVGALILAQSGVAMAGIGAVLMGAALGTESDLTGYLVARYFGMRAFGVIYGCLYAAFLVGIALGPLLAGMVFDRTFDYQLALYGAAAVFATAALLSTLLGKFPVFVPAHDLAHAPAHDVRHD